MRNDLISNAICFYVACLERCLFVTLMDLADEKEAKKILSERYERWVENENVMDVCCEDYMLDGLRAAGIEFYYGYEETNDLLF